MCDFCKDIGTTENAVLTHEMGIGMIRKNKMWVA